MSASNPIRILRARGTDEVVLPPTVAGRTAVLVGFIAGPCTDGTQRAARRERTEIARTYARIGCEVYQTHYDPRQRASRGNRRASGWANDLYVQCNGTVIPAEGPFRELGKGGHYVFGEEFVLVSRRIEEEFRRQMKEHSGFRHAFAGRRIHFVEPYVLRLQTTARIRCVRLGHIDLTIGYVPEQRVLTIADLHYSTVKVQVQAIAKRHGLKIEPTSIDPALQFHPFVNNYFVLNPGTPRQVVVANRHAGFHRQLQATGANVRTPRIPITHLPVYRGAIKCVSNQAPSAQLFAHLGITYRPFPFDGAGTNSSP